MTVTLQPITKENWYQCAQLQIRSDQHHFVEPVFFSIAQSKFEPERAILAIYHENTLVGFVMYNDQPLHDGTYRISRLLIDQKCQGLGYGRAAIIQVLDRLRQIASCKEVLVEYSPDNAAAAHLYSSLGFVPFGQTKYSDEDYDIIARLRF